MAAPLIYPCQVPECKVRTADMIAMSRHVRTDHPEIWSKVTGDRKK